MDFQRKDRRNFVNGRCGFFVPLRYGFGLYEALR